MMTTIQQPTQALPFTVVGFFPSGEGFSDTVPALRAEEAMLRVLAGLRYTEDGGDLEVSCVLDATGEVVDDAAFASHTMMSETDALDSLVAQLRAVIPGPALTAGDGTIDVGDIDKLNAYLELVELVLSDAPLALDGIAGCAQGYAEEDQKLQFIDSMGQRHEIIPAEALLSLTEKSQELGWNPAAAQIEELATRARGAVSIAIIDALCY